MKDCDLWFDVHHMTMDELESVMENCTAALDVVPSEPIGDLEEESQSRILCPTAGEPCALAV